MGQKKQPLRRCTGCKQMKPKSELLRVVRGTDGLFSMDMTGKKPGRGAYVCGNGECIEKANKTRGFERSFKSPVPKEVYEGLKTLAEESVDG